MLLHISSSYAKILGKQIFSSGVSLKWVKSKRRRKKKKNRGLNDGNKNGQLRIANATSGGARKAAKAKKVSVNNGQPHLQPQQRVAHASRLDQ